MTGIPDMMSRIFHVQNRRAALFSVFLGVFAPLTALLMMHFGGQGEWSDMSLFGWMGRFVALCCVVVSTPKVFRFFKAATENHTLEALAATLAVEVSALMAVSKVVGLYAFAIQVMLNILVYSNSIALDQKHIKAAEREDKPISDTLNILTKQVAVEPKTRPVKTIKTPAKPRKSRKVITLKTSRKNKRTA